MIFLLLNKNNYIQYNKVDYGVKKTENIIISILERYFIDKTELQKIVKYIKNIKYHEKPLYDYFKKFIYNNLNLKI